MKTVQIVTQMEGGGAQRVGIVLQDELEKRGEQSELWFLYVKRSTYMDQPNIQVILPYQPKHVFDYYKIIMLLFKKLVAEKPKVIISHTHYSNVIVQPIAWLLGVANRIAVQHNPVESYPLLARGLDVVLGTIGCYTTNVVVSESVLSSLKNYPNKYLQKTQQINNGVFVGESSGNVLSMKEKLGIHENSQVIINVGRLSQQKNQLLLIEMLAYLSDVHLLIVGDGELRSKLVKEAKKREYSDRIHFLGEIKPQEVVNYLKLADVFVFPSLFEAMGLALVEAMNAGLPIVATDLPATREVLGCEFIDSAGILVGSGDVKGFADATRMLLNNKELADGQAAIAKQRAKRYSVDNMADAYQKCYSI
ncbi:hypothetical protein ASG89_30085 [Paenibacillus sp. Soil766]|uniref:glycosyltransferase family 4 protein n=1 Tax=Paenibacillus sp. Soil766 TaxID=1736404 RepID=UPI00071037AF|nr:glycosyltransferase family 4 protein [Paenibacillus sp. Soil766]KRE97106.1 hypothetical protein ASG89_30085 [Paenibacillus sp. Soil766]